MAEVFARAAGRPVCFHTLPIEQFRARSEEMATMFDCSTPWASAPMWQPCVNTTPS
ncbi:hypothetical protein [Streptomyces sp. NPDC057199]|uniref:hypothetical protein n=1 Tax=Streptomyces sp. NPDC057199 TaxID=3346047 RepID=UPI0036389FB1